MLNFCCNVKPTIILGHLSVPSQKNGQVEPTSTIENREATLFLHTKSSVDLLFKRYLEAIRIKREAFRSNVPSLLTYSPHY